MTTFTDDYLFSVAALLPTGRQFAIKGASLAADLDVSERTVRMLVEELRDRGWLVGSTISGDRPGYFMCVDLVDLEVGTAHLRSRGKSLLKTFHRMQRTAEVRFGDEGLRLFDLDEVPAR